MSQVQLVLPILAKIHIQKFIFAIAIIGLLVNQNLVRNFFNSMSTGHGRILLFLVCWAVLSVPFGVYPGQSFTFMTESYWKTLVMCLLVIAYPSSKDELNKLIWIYILAVSLLSITTLLMSSASRIAINVDVYDANDTAFQFLLATPFVLWKFKSSMGIKKLLLAAIFLFLLVATIKTGSRGGFMGIAIVVTAFLFQSNKIDKTGMLRPFLIISFIAAIIIYSSTPEYLDRIATIFSPSTDYNMTSSTGRIEIWKRGLDLLINNPLLGVGVINFISAEGMFYVEEGARWNAAHNSFVQVGAELGFPGLIAFCILIWRSVRSSYNFSKMREKLESEVFWKYTSLSVAGAWIGFIIGGSLLSAAYTSYFYFLLGLSFSFIRIASFHYSEEQNKL